MVKFTNNGVRDDFCRTKRCFRIEQRIQKRASRDEQRTRRRIGIAETDFATYTAALIDLQARRAREVSEKR